MAREPGEPDLIWDIRRELEADTPLGLLSLASGIIEAARPDPFGDRQPRIGLSELVESFAEADMPETIALLAAMQPLLTGKREAAIAERGLRRSNHPRPEFEPVQVTGTAVLWDRFHDAEDVILSVRTAAGDDFSLIVLVDHNLGSVVKDVLYVDGDLEATLEPLERSGAEDIIEHPLSPADARKRITEAIEWGERMFPPIENESWPMARSLVEWVVRSLPGGGTGYEHREWSVEDREQIMAQFLASPFAADLDDDQRGMIDPLLWFGCDYGIGEPLNWSPVRVEMFLVDWAPRKLIIPDETLRKLPDLLRAFVRFGHRELDFPGKLTAETLQAVDHFEPQFRVVLRQFEESKGQILSALGDQMFGLPHDWLERKVGGPEELAALDDTPLPDEPFRWEGIPDDIRPEVTEVLRQCDELCDLNLTVEHRTALRRILAKVAVADPAIFRRGSKIERTAAALVWIMGKANDLFDPWDGIVVADMLEWFGLTGSVTQRAETMLRAIGADDSWFSDTCALGDPNLLVSEMRRSIMEERDLRGF